MCISLIKLQRIKENMVKHNNSFGFSHLSRNSCQAAGTYLSWNLAAFLVFVSSSSPRKLKDRLLPVLQKTKGAVQGFWGWTGCWGWLLPPW